MWVRPPRVTVSCLVSTKCDEVQVLLGFLGVEIWWVFPVCLVLTRGFRFCVEVFGVLLLPVMEFTEGPTIPVPARSRTHGVSKGALD